MSRLIWSPRALLYVQGLYRFLAVNNMDASIRAIKTIWLGITVLDQQAGIGRPVDDLPVEFREWMIDFVGSSYVVRYRIDANAVTILAVCHQNQAGF